MKILRIKSCYKCEYYRLTYDYDSSLTRFLCQHPAWKLRKKHHRIINKKLAAKGNIPGWCQLEDVFFPIDISKGVEL